MEPLIFLQYSILSSAAIVLIAKFVDFLIGKSGNKWIKGHILLKSWFVLQSFTPLSIFKKAAHGFASATELLFGKRLFSLQAFSISWAIGSGLIPYLYVLLDKPLKLTKQLDYEFSTLAWAGVFIVINPLYDMLSFAVTRYLARRISDSEKIIYALLFWIIDIVLCIVISVASYFTVEAFLSIFAPKLGLSLWLDRVVAHDPSVFASLTGLFPTSLHLLFFLVSLFLGLLELLRRFICLLLERFDESEKNVLTIMTGSLAAIGTFLGTLVSFLIKTR